MRPAAGPAVEDLLRELAPQVLGAVIRRSGDFAAAEDAVQEALLAAVLHWPAEGVPGSPRGWLIQAALRRLTDQVRSDQARRRREAVVAAEPPAAAASNRDDTLLLLFMCCPPALSTASAIALTLRAVGGLSTAQIARAFLVPEATMAQRISRAKQRIKASGVPLAPRADSEEGRPRLRAVLHVLYLIFNEGYTSSAGADLHRVELSAEAIRLARMVHGLLPGDGEVAGLLALMLLTDARRPARCGPGGELIPLADQDRTRWDQRLIAEGVALLADALPRGVVGEYQLQAAIAALHDQAARAGDTDWPQILACYRLLERMTGNPLVTLGRAVATAMVHGPDAGLALLNGLDEPLAGHYRLDAVRAHLLEMSGDPQAALSYRAAAQRTTSIPERNYLMLKAARLRHPAPP